MLNCVAIVGRLVADPELKTTSSGISVTSFTVAVERSYVRQGEERQTDFIDVVAWRQTAEFTTKYFRKGSWIAVKGSIQTRTYEDKNGIKRKAVEVSADNIDFCSNKSDNQGSYSGGTYNAAPAPAAAPAPSFSTADEGSFKEVPEDDLPF